MRSDQTMSLDTLTPASRKGSVGFFLIMTYLFMEYVRPQDILSSNLAIVHPALSVIPLMGLQILFSSALRLENRLIKLVLVLLFLCALHVPFAENNYWAFQITKTMFIYVIVFLSITMYVDSPQKIVRFMNFWIIVNVLLAFIGLLNGGKVPKSSFMGDENDFALVMNMAVPVAYFMSLSSSSLQKKILYWFAMALFVAANVTSLSRGGFIGLIAVALYCWYKTPRKVLVTVLLVLLMGVVSFAASEKYWTRIESIQKGGEMGSGEERLYSWGVAWRMFVDNPVIGVGPGNFPWNAGRYEPPGGIHTKSIAGRVAHSVYFTLLPELGGVGTILFIGILYEARRNSKWVSNVQREIDNSVYEDSDNPANIHSSRIRDEVNSLKLVLSGVNGAMAGYLISGVFLSVLYYPHFWIFIAINAAIKDTIGRITAEVPGYENLQDLG